MPAQPLLGKSALVTGGARRIGRAIALALAQAGANVAITYRTSSTEAESTAADLRSFGVQALALPMDLHDPAGVQAVVSKAASSFGTLDILVNNAGVFSSAPLDQLTVEQWDQAFATNTRGPFLVARAALPWLRQSQGRIINLGSLGANHPWATHAHYCASKAALEMLTRTMAKSFAPQVSVNLVAPGWVEMPSDDTQLAARFAARTPMGRNGSAEEIASVVLFFATGPHFITGQSLAVDGGLGLT